MLLRKELSLELAEVKFAANAREFVGYASTFGGEPDSYGDIIQKGAFVSSLKERRPLMLWSHDTNEVIGKWTAVNEDSKGLHVAGRLTEGVRRADEAYALLKDGAVSGMSIGYQTVKSSKADKGVRVLEEVRLFEISIVGVPANDNARVDAVKSAIADIESLSDAERLLRDAGVLSRSEAVAFVSRIKAIVQRDSDATAEMKTVAELLRRNNAIFNPALRSTP
jgi:HK97 family phage prohead protease